jgi:leader peptidase (prepilin peptidase)/N-methyltransferase
MIAIFWIDLEHMIIPDVISLNCIPVGISAAIVGAIPGVDWKLSLIGTIVGTAVLWLPAEIYSRLRGIEGLGGGDIKLLGMIGAFTGPSGVLFVLFVSSTIGAAVGLLGMATRRTDSTTPIPFGPFLTLAALLYVLAGQEIVKWSLGAVALA